MRVLLHRIKRTTSIASKRSISSAFISMSSSLINLASRVLSVDQEQSSFAPIIGLDKARDTTIGDAVALAWASCPQLRAAMSADDVEVRPQTAKPRRDQCQWNVMPISSSYASLGLPSNCPRCVSPLHEPLRLRPPRSYPGRGGGHPRVHAGVALLPRAERAPQGH